MKPSSESELLARHHRLKLALTAITEEMEIVENELRALASEPTLDDLFFIEEVAPVLGKAKGGMTSSHLRYELSKAFGPIGEVKFRTFISRQKSRGNLMTFESSKPVKWQVTPTVASKLARLGKAVVEQPAEWQEMISRRKS